MLTQSTEQIDALVTAEDTPCSRGPRRHYRGPRRCHRRKRDHTECDASVWRSTPIPATRFQCPTQAKTPQHPAEDLLYFPIMKQHALDLPPPVRLLVHCALKGFTAIETKRLPNSTRWRSFSDD